MRNRVILLITFLSFNLLTGADSPFAGKRVEATSHLLAYQTYTSNKTISPKAALTIVGDIGHELGLVSDNQLDALYKDSKGWLNSVTADDLKAKTQEGIVSLHDFQKNSARDMLFTEMGKILSPALGGMDPQQVGQLLKYYQDQKTAKEAAKDQKLKDAGQVVAVAAAAVLTYFTAGSTAPLLETLLAAAPEIGAVTAANLATQVYIAGETGGGQNGSIAAAVNAVGTTLTAGSSSAVSGYVTWTPHRAGNLITGEDAVKGGWGGGVTFGEKGTSGFLKDVGLNGTLSFQPGSGIGVNLNVVPPGSAGMPNGTFFGISYQSGSGDYTASGGFNVASYGKNGMYGGTGISFSVSKDGTANVGLNYSGKSSSTDKGMQALLNGMKGLSLNFSSDGQLTLSNQFRGADAFSLGYNTNTHSFNPIGVNGNFQNNFLANLVQENAAKNAEANAKLLEEKKKVWLENQRQKPSYENLSDTEIFAKYKSENSVVQDGSRTDLSSQILGAFGDMFSGSTGFGNLSSNEGYLDAKGDFVPNTCFTAGTLVHTKTGTKKIEEIEVGDQVLSWDEESGEKSYKTVTELFVHDINQLFDVEVNDNETFHTTWNHPFWVVNERSWVKVKDLKVGDIVQLKDGSEVPISKISSYSVSMTQVYNLEIEENHTYYVGKDGVLVHNYDLTGEVGYALKMIQAEFFRNTDEYGKGVVLSAEEAAARLKALHDDIVLCRGGGSCENLVKRGINTSSAVVDTLYNLITSPGESARLAMQGTYNTVNTAVDITSGEEGGRAAFELAKGGVTAGILKGVSKIFEALFPPQATKYILDKNGKYHDPKTGQIVSTSEVIGGRYGTVTAVPTAESVNLALKAKGYTDPPYKPGTKVSEITISQETKFVRVFDGEVAGQKGGFMMRAEDIKGLTPLQIKDKFALNYVPKFVTDVTLKVGDKIRGGIANALPGKGSGGGFQFDTMGQWIGEYGEIKPLN